MTSPQRIIQKYIEILEASLIDPNTHRRSLGKKWIYDDYPRLDITHYPRISITSPISTIKPLDLGYNKELEECNIQVLIIVKKGFRGEINGETKRDLEVLDILAENIKTIVRDNLDSLKSIGVIFSFPENENYIQSDNVYMKQIIFKNLYTR